MHIRHTTRHDSCVDLYVEATHLAFEHDTLLAPFSEHHHVITLRTDLDTLDDRGALRVRLQVDRSS